MVKYIIIGILAFVVLIALLIFVPILLIPNGWLDSAAKWSLFLISGFLCLLIAVMIALTALVAALVGAVLMLVKKADPLVEKLTETADTAKGTVAYVGEGVVSPLIKVSMILAAIRGAINALFRGRS
jgi:hypothetical protein